MYKFFYRDRQIFGNIVIFSMRRPTVKTLRPCKPHAVSQIFVIEQIFYDISLIM